MSGDSFSMMATSAGVALPDEADDRLVYLRASDGGLLFSLKRGTSYQYPEALVQLGHYLVFESNRGDLDTYAPYLESVSLWSGRVLAGRSVRIRSSPGYPDPFYSIGPATMGAFPGPGGWLFLQDARMIVTVQGGVGGRLHGLYYTDLNRGSAAADRDHIYVQVSSWDKADLLSAGDTTRLIALDRLGRPVWQAVLPRSERQSLSSADDYGHLVVTPRLVLVPGSHALYAVNRRNGRMVWRGTPTQPVAAGAYGYGIAPGVPRREDYRAVRDDTFFAFSLATGRRVWSRRVGKTIGPIFAHGGRSTWSRPGNRPIS